MIQSTPSSLQLQSAYQNSASWLLDEVLNFTRNRAAPSWLVWQCSGPFNEATAEVDDKDQSVCNVLFFLPRE